MQVSIVSGWAPRGVVLSYKRLMGMCHWMGSHFHDWIDYNGVAVSIQFLERGSHIFGFFGVRQFFIVTVSKLIRMFVPWVKSKVFFIQSKKWVSSLKQKVTKLSLRKLHICPKDGVYNWSQNRPCGRGQLQYPAKINPSWTNGRKLVVFLTNI